MFIFNVLDDGMSWDRIFTGDKVAVKVEEHYTDNDILAVIHKSKLIIRRLKIEKDGCKLIPSNKDYSSIHTTDLYIIGKVVRTYIKQ